MSGSDEDSHDAPSGGGPLRLARFRRLWVAQTLLNTGHYLQGVAAAWVMVDLTSSPFWVGVAVAAPLLPNLGLSLVAGALSDLVDRRRLLVVASAMMAAASLATGALWNAGLLSPITLAGLEVLLGIGLALFAPAWQASVANMVPVGLVPGAVALNSASGAVATAVGPALGGAIIAAVGPGWAFGAGAAGYVSMIAVLAPLRERPWRDDAGPLAAAIVTGLQHVRHTSIYRSVLVTIALFGVTSASLRALLPSIVSDTLGGDAALYGALLGLLGGGALLGALTRGRAGALLGRSLVPAAMMAFGVAGVAAGLARQPVTAAVAITVAGVMWTWVLATANATMQLLSPAWARGRTMSVFLLAFSGLTPLGALASGALGDVVGASTSLVACSAAVVLAGVYSWRRAPLPRGEIAAEEAGADDGEPTPRAPRTSVAVTVDWRVAADDEARWLDAMERVRTARLGAGARGWRLHRDADEATTYLESFRLVTWAECRLHGARLGAGGRAALSAAEVLDRRGGPRVRVGLPVDPAPAPADRQVTRAHPRG